MQYLEPEVGQHLSFGLGGTQDLSTLHLYSVSELMSSILFCTLTASLLLRPCKRWIIQYIDDGKLGF